jgi:hypothetical protein
MLLRLATGEITDPEPPKKNAAAVELGKRGGLKGGKARWKGVSKKDRTKLAQKAAKSRWRKQRSKP